MSDLLPDLAPMWYAPQGQAPAYTVCSKGHTWIGLYAECPTCDKVRTFPTGATRDQDATKLDYEGFISPLVLARFAQYMDQHRQQPDGSVRDSDNWQKGIPLDAYMKSGWRHFMDWWLEHRGHASREGLEDALCGLLFNTMGYLHEVLQRAGKGDRVAAKEVDHEIPTAEPAGAGSDGVQRPLDTDRTQQHSGPGRGSPQRGGSPWGRPDPAGGTRP